jgi:hypothetical protein
MILKRKVIVKTDNSDDSFKKWKSDNIMSFTKFLDREYPNWKYMNVYSDTGEQVGSFTKYRRPIRHI